MRQPGNSFGGGKLGGTPINNERMPFSASLSHTAGSWIDPDVAIDRPSYVWSLRLRKP